MINGIKLAYFLVPGLVELYIDFIQYRDVVNVCFLLLFFFYLIEKCLQKNKYLGTYFEL